MDWPPVYQLCRQAHRWVSASGRDKRWKHLSAKPATRLDFHWGSLQTTTLIGCRCKHSNMFSRAVLIARELFFSPPWTKRRRQAEFWAIPPSSTLQEILLAYRTYRKLLFLYTCSKTNTDIQAIDSVGVPPLPIPNREVKPNSADGTAKICGRVGHRRFYKRHSIECLFLYMVLTSSPGNALLSHPARLPLRRSPDYI